MGIIDSNNLKGIRGKVGNLVVYEVNGKTRVRSTPDSIRNPKTPAQQMARSRLVATLRFYQRVQKTDFAGIWKKSARPLATNGYALFMKTNLPAYSAERTVFDFSQLHLSTGELYPLFNPAVVQQADGSIHLRWNYPYLGVHCHASDRLMIGMLTGERSFSPRRLEGISAERRDGEATFRLPALPEGETVHLYCFFADADGENYSNDWYYPLTQNL